MIRMSLVNQNMLVMITRTTQERPREGAAYKGVLSALFVESTAASLTNKSYKHQINNHGHTGDHPRSSKALRDP